ARLDREERAPVAAPDVRLLPRGEAARELEGDRGLPGPRLADEERGPPGAGRDGLLELAGDRVAAVSAGKPPLARRGAEVVADLGQRLGSLELLLGLLPALAARRAGEERVLL